MSDRSRSLSRAPVLAIAIGAIGSLTLVAAQTRTAPATRWTAPRTPDGHPDLQGTWLSRSATPLERPAALAGKAWLSDEEVAELKARAERIFARTGSSDFAAGDAVFLTALANRDRFTSPTSTHGAADMIEREFDHHTSLVTDPSDGRIPPLTPEAQRRQQVRAATLRGGDGPESLDNANRCIAWGVPRLGGRYGAGDLGYYQIVQAPGYIALFMETGHEARIVSLDGRPHLPSRVGQRSGDSRGRWEGDVLVIETTNFSAKSYFMGAAEHLHLTERLTRTDADTITYQMTFDDPTTWTRPWTAEMPLKRTDELLYESACHEGNEQMMLGMLSAARVQGSPAPGGR